MKIKFLLPILMAASLTSCGNNSMKYEGTVKEKYTNSIILKTDLAISSERYECYLVARNHEEKPFAYDFVWVSSSIVYSVNLFVGQKINYEYNGTFSLYIANQIIS